VFQGETAITIDDKGRLAIPTGLRETLACAGGERLVITHSPFDPCLYIYPYPAWEVARDWVNAQPMNPDVRQMQRMLVGGAAVVEPDGNGRISLPASHRATKGIERKVVLIGMGHKFELWSEPAYQQQMLKTLGDVDFGCLPAGVL